MIDFVAIDFETANQHRTSACSVGIVIVRNGIIVDRIYHLIRPFPNFYTWWATDCHGLSFRDTYNAPEFPIVWAAIAQQIGGLPLVAHNSPFDEGCLRAALEVYRIPYPNYKFYCTCRMARKMFPELRNHKLPTVAAHVGFCLNNHHDALADAEACAMIAKKIFNLKENMV